MVDGITWTRQYQKTIFEDSECLLKGLEEDGQQNLGNLNKYLPPKAGKERKNNTLLVLEDINFVESKKMPHGRLYKLLPEGRIYINSKKKEKNYIFHSNLYKNILHYSYAFDRLLQEDNESFYMNKFLQNLVSNSSDDFGVRIYDWRSAQYVVNFMEALKVIYKIGDEYFVDENYRRDFDEKSFLKLIEKSFKKENPQFTKTLCEYLLENSSKFLVTKELVTIETIYKKLLQVNETKDFLTFIPGLPRAPIPSKHTLIELRGSNYE